MAAALSLMLKVRPSGKPVRLIGIGVSGLGPPQRQLSLWDTSDSEKSRNLQKALDKLRERYGEKTIKRGSQ